MNKYPLDLKAIEDISRDLVQHEKANILIIHTLAGFLKAAMEDAIEQDMEDAPWYEEANKFLASLLKRKFDFETHRFNQNNGHNIKDVSPYPASPEQAGRIIDVHAEQKLNALEATFGEEMSEQELAQHFNEPTPRKKKDKFKPLNKMKTLEEIEEWERSQDNSNDIYKVSARIKNLARQSAGANLTTAGDVLCNSFTHVMKTLYDFAETIEDKDLKIKLIEQIRAHEGMPAGVVSALAAGVHLK